MLHPRQRGRRGKAADDGKSPVSGIFISLTRETTTWGKTFPLVSKYFARAELTSRRRAFQMRRISSEKNKVISTSQLHPVTSTTRNNRTKSRRESTVTDQALLQKGKGGRRRQRSSLEVICILDQRILHMSTFQVEAVGITNHDDRVKI